MIGTVIDIETTGWLRFNTVDGWSTLSDDSEILEVGFININMDTKEILTHGTLYFYKPYFNIESDAQSVHGLTREFLQKYEQDFEKNLIALNALIQNTCIIGKNSNKFDIPFIRAFIEKHAGNIFDFEALSLKLNMKGYNGGTIIYHNEFKALDMQEAYKPIWRERHYEMYQFYPAGNKKGKLEDYIECLPGGLEATGIVYDSLHKERVAGAHSALYDAVMTYIVWCDAKNKGIC